MMKRLVLLAALFLGLSSVAIAADRSEFQLIGYSPDSKYFAFEEFGVQDGSGFAYSSVFVIDVINDKWVAGGPFRFRTEDENVKLFEARSNAIAMAAEALLELNIQQPARLIALNGDGEAPQPGLGLQFHLPGYTGIDAMWGDYELSLETFDLPPSKNCEGFAEDGSKGFALFLEASSQKSLVYKDKKLPKSRNCPIAYRITGVVIPFEERSLEHAIALISVWSYGFEGPDRRFIAIPLHYKD